MRCFHLITLFFLSSYSWGYYLASPLLDRLNLINEKKTVYEVFVVNNEKEAIEIDLQIGKCKTDLKGNTKLEDLEGSGFQVEILTKNRSIEPKEKKGFTISINAENVPKETAFTAIGVLVSKKEKPAPLNGPEKNKPQVKIVQNFLIQLFTKTAKAPNGTVELKTITKEGKKVILELANHSKNLLDTDLFFFMNKGAEAVKEPIVKKVRVLPDQSRLFELDLPEELITQGQLFIDDPNFDLYQKELKF